MYLLIGGDVVPTKDNIVFFSNGDAETLVGSRLAEIIRNADYRIFNLETPLCDKKDPIVKAGPNLAAPCSCAAGLKALGADLVTLANNHIMDQGTEGLVSTLEMLNTNGIFSVGGGLNLSAASERFVFRFGGKQIGVYGCAEHEFSIADEEKAGANPFDPLWSLDHIDTLKKETDYVIVLYHGGKEHYQYPSPQLQKTCRRFIDKGADLVICQHSHCIGCEEKYKNGTIIYGQGNLIFHQKAKLAQTGLLVQLHEDLSISYIPVNRTESGIKLAEKEDGEEILRGFALRSEKAKDPEFLREQYQRLANASLLTSLSVLSGRKTLWRRFKHKLTKGSSEQKYLISCYKKENKIKILNRIECEAHRELLIQAIKQSEGL